MKTTAALFLLLALSGCGTKKEETLPLRDAEATPYINYYDTEAGGYISNRETDEQLSFSMDNDKYVRLGEFNFLKSEHSYICRLPQNESLSFEIFYEGPPDAVNAQETAEEARCSIAERLSERSAEGFDTDILTADIHHASQNGSAHEEGLGESLSAAEYFSSRGLRTQIRRKISTEDGEERFRYMCTVICTPEEMFSLAEESNMGFMIGSLHKNTELSFSEIIWEGGK